MSKVGKRIQDLLFVSGVLLAVLSGASSAQEKNFNAAQFLETTASIVIPKMHPTANAIWRLWTWPIPAWILS